MMTLAKTKYIVLTALFFCLVPFFVQAEGLIADQSFKSDKEILVTFSGAVDKAVAEDVTNYTVFEEPDPDIRLVIGSAVLGADGKSLSLTFAEPLNTAMTHVVTIKGLAGIETTTFTVSKSYLGYLFGILISALIDQQLRFHQVSRSLCLFWNVEEKRDR